MPAENNHNYAILTATLPSLCSVKENAELIGRDVTLELLQLAVENQDCDALQKVLWLSAYHQFTLPAELFCKCLTLCEQFLDIIALLEFQPVSLATDLLVMADDGHLILYRRIWALCMASTFFNKIELDKAKLNKLLLKLRQQTEEPIIQLDAIELAIVNPEYKPPALQMFYISLSELLPETAPKNLTHGRFTLRRSVEKLGRNEPCHCSSGKKYKKCCMNDDQTRLDDASAFQGITKTELKNNPGIINDAAVIDNLKAHEIKDLKADKLGDKQLFAAFRQASNYEQWQLAFEMLLSCKNRLSEEVFDSGHFDDLLRSVLNAGDSELARQIEPYCMDASDSTTQVHFDLQENPQHYQKLETVCLQAITNPDEFHLSEITYHFENNFPGLAAVLARVAIASQPEAIYDNDSLLEIIHGIRIDLDLDPWQDPAESLFEWQQASTEKRSYIASNSAEKSKLPRELKSARQQLKNKQVTLQQAEEELLQKDKQLEEQQIEQQQNNKVAQPSDNDQLILRLRNKVENLKGEISSQQKLRNQLKEALKAEREQKNSTQFDHKQTIKHKNTIEAVLTPIGKLLLPVYKHSFSKSCEQLPEQIVRKAMIAIGQFSGHDPEIWRLTKKIKQLNDYYRIRIHRGYRLLLHWQPNEELSIVDIIPRQNLENWIKRH